MFVISCDHKNNEIIQRWENGQDKAVYYYSSLNDKTSYVAEYYYENGILAFRGKFKKSKRFGLWEWWYDNGNKKKEVKYYNNYFINDRKYWRKNGTLAQVEQIPGACLGRSCDVDIIIYGVSGQKLIEYSIEYGLKHGEFVNYYSNGVTKRRQTYLYNEKQGISYEYHLNGAIKSEGSYFDNLKDGEWTYWDSTGQIIVVEKYQVGNLLEKSLTSSSTP